MIRLYLDSRTFGVEYEKPYQPLPSPFDALTEYPFYKLGDEPGKFEPKRRVLVVDHDNNKYATVILPNGQREKVEWGYLFREVPEFLTE